MKISKISIKGYRSCKSTTFKPHEELTVLIGPNGSGKTNILSAIKLLSSLFYTRRRMRFPTKEREELFPSACQIKTWFDFHGKKIIHTAKINVITNERNEDEVLSSNENWHMYDITGSKKKINMPLEFLFPTIHHQIHSSYNSTKYRAYMMREIMPINSSKAIAALSEVVKFISSITYYSASQFTNPSNCPISFEVEAEGDSELRRGISIRSSHKAFLYDMYMEHKKNSEAYNEFISIIGPDGIGLIDSIEFREIKTSSSAVSVYMGGRTQKKEKLNLLVVPGFNISDSTLSPSQLSEGTFKTIALIFYIITDKSQMLMIEEPEVCVHHGLLNSVVELIKTYSKEKQIFISTHSDSVLDSLTIENVFSVKNNEEGTAVNNISKSMSKKEIEALKIYLSSEGSLGEFWKHGDLESV